jgi:hypothetical protein
MRRGGLRGRLEQMLEGRTTRGKRPTRLKRFDRDLVPMGASGAAARALYGTP